MNIIQYLLFRFFNYQYVLLSTANEHKRVCKAYQLGNKFYAHPYVPHTRGELLPGGKVNGPSYVSSWDPITPETFKLYNM